MQVVNYVVNHNYMRSYHVIFPSCHAYAKNCTENDHLVIPFILLLWRDYFIALMTLKTQTVTLVKKHGKGEFVTGIIYIVGHMILVEKHNFFLPIMTWVKLGKNCII